MTATFAVGTRAIATGPTDFATLSAHIVELNHQSLQTKTFLSAHNIDVDHQPIDAGNVVLGRHVIELVHSDISIPSTSFTTHVVEVVHQTLAFTTFMSSHTVNLVHIDLEPVSGPEFGMRVDEVFGVTKTDFDKYGPALARLVGGAALARTVSGVGRSRKIKGPSL